MKSGFLLYIVLFTALTVLIWVSLDIIHSQAKIEISSEVKSLIEPITPEFDSSIVSEL